MERLFDETYSTEDQSSVSRNIWYGYIELYTDSHYGKSIVLDKNLMDIICETVLSDKEKKNNPQPTESNWYIYGKSFTQDAIKDKVRPSIMIRYKDDKFLVRCNFSDCDFAISIDKILLFENDLERRLTSCI